jgi:hypothetical protein
MSFRVKNRAVAHESDYERDASGSQVHVLICALDYKGTDCELTCTLDGNNMQALCRACGVSSMEVMYDNQCTTDNVTARIQQMAGRMGENDYFVFYYSGHGTSVDDDDGDEDDGKDEALCFMDPSGGLDSDYFMTDDDFAECLVDTIPEGVRIIIMADCCHSGTIGDLDKEIWEGREVISMSGCTDDQTSGDIGRGGIFTHSMLLALEKLSSAGQEDFSVGMLYNATVREDDAVFNSAQDIQMECPEGLRPNQMAWPLVPKGPYKSPLKQAQQQVAPPKPPKEDGDDSESEDEEEDESNNLAVQLQNNPALAQQLGIKPEMMQFIAPKLGKLLGQNGEQYMELLDKFAQSGACKKCSIM